MIETQNAPFLLVDPVHDLACPVSSHAFEFMSSLRSRVLARNATALFLTAEGAVLHMTDAIPQCTGLRSTLKLSLGFPIAASYRFEEIKMPLEDLKVMLVDCAIYMRNSGNRNQDWWLTTSPLETVREVLSHSNSFRALYAAIPMARSDTQDKLI